MELFIFPAFLADLALIPWCIIVCGFGTMLYCTTEEKYGFSTFTFFLAYGLIDWLNNWHMSIFVYKNPQIVILYILGYCIIGCLWSVIKFYAHMRKLTDGFKERKKNWIVNNITTDMTQEQVEKAWSHCHITLPSFKEASNGVIWWMIYWPFSMIMSFMKDAIYNFFHWIFRTFSGVYKRIYNRMLAEANKS